jgi:thiamine-phosphate pyrophosphorylase
MKRAIDYSLYLVTERDLCRDKGLLELVAEAVAGGVSVVQLREKRVATSEYLWLARELLDFLRPLGVPLFVNDRVDVALAAGADGVHVGQDDMPVRDVRRLVGESMAIGLTVNSLEQVMEAETLPVDYLGAGPAFATQTKETAKPVLGAEGIRLLRNHTSLPLVAIGGIDAENAGEIMDAGADGVAVVSALCSSGSPRSTAETLLRAVRSGRRAG